jgi:APA family basic amino acid/polyamine antiporter
VAGSFEWSATLSALSRLAVYGSTAVALLLLRRRDPEGAAFRLPGGPLLPLSAILFCAVLLTRMGRTEVVLFAIVTFLATLHWLAVRNRSRATA